VEIIQLELEARQRPGARQPRTAGNDGTQARNVFLEEFQELPKTFHDDFTSVLHLLEGIENEQARVAVQLEVAQQSREILQAPNMIRGTRGERARACRLCR